MEQKTPLALRYLIPRFQDFVYISILLLGVFFGPRFLGDGDPGRHIVVGQIVLTQGYIPQNDIFSHTRTGLPLTTTEWLSEVLFAGAHLLMGLNGVVLLAAGLIAVTCTLVFRETADRSRSYLASFLLVYWMAVATLFHWLARPHLFSWLMAAIWSILVRRLAQGQKTPLWLFPLIMLVWANLHGGFVIGFLILVAYLVGWVFDRMLNKDNLASTLVLRHLSIVTALSLLGTGANPVGYRLWNSVVVHVGDSRLMSLQIDWRSPDFHSPNAWPFLLLVAVFIILFSIKRKRMAAGPALMAGGLAMLAFYSVRNIPFFVIACLPVLGEALGDLLGGLRLSLPNERMAALQKDLRGFAWSGIATVVVALLLLSGQKLDMTKIGNTFDPARFPVKAVDWLQEHPQSGNLYNEFTWGGYVLYRLWPGTKVFIDGQTDFYGADLASEYLDVLNVKDGWENTLDKYQVAWVLIPKNSALANRLEMDPGWNSLYEDDVAVILRKRTR